MINFDKFIYLNISKYLMGDTITGDVSHLVRSIDLVLSLKNFRC